MDGEPVQLWVYDLSGGMAALYSQMLLGRRVRCQLTEWAAGLPAASERGAAGRPALAQALQCALSRQAVPQLLLGA